MWMSLPEGHPPGISASGGRQSASLEEAREPHSPAPPSTPRLLKALDGGLALLASRGIPVPRRALADGYARFLATEALGLTDPEAPSLPEGSSLGEDAARPAPGEDRSRPPARGHHARSRSGVRYWISGRRPDDGERDLVVPGIPGRAFDRILVVGFDIRYGVDFAGSAPSAPFLRAAEYREEANEWALGLSSPFWRGPSVEDVTILFRITARRLEIGDGPEARLPDVEPTPRIVPGGREVVRRTRRRSREREPTPEERASRATGEA